MIHRKKNRSHWTFKIVKSRQSYSSWPSVWYPSVEQPRFQGPLLIQSRSQSLFSGFEAGLEKALKTRLLLIGPAQGSSFATVVE